MMLARLLVIAGLLAVPAGPWPAWAQGGPVTLAQFRQRDQQVENRLLKEFEAATGIRVQQRIMPASTDLQHQQYVTWLAGRDRSVDVYLIDLIWVAEFAAAGWILPLESRLPAEARDGILPAPLASAHYRGKLYAIPRFTESGLLYYRKDLVPTAPATWEELRGLARAKRGREVAGYVFQGKQYEGLVVNFLELLWSAGGEVLAPDGRVLLNGPAGAAALTYLVELVGSGAAPRGVITYMERESLQEFLEGRALFHRNWSYAWSLVHREGSKVRGKVGVAPLPSWDGRRPGVAALGGWHLALSAYSERRDAGWRLIRFLTDTRAQKAKAIGEGRLPTLASLYADPDVLEANPHFAALQQGLAHARHRPITPFYPRLSAVLQTHLSRALVGSSSPQEALDAAAREIATFVARE
ncbi:MAG: ABC transporter substrate-binding protein [candidate division NC10 bacterium]|nr:ABC transporter substrate-binding protein [candidate division NC10 bacterium]